MIGGVSVFLNQLLLTSDLHFHTCAVKSSSDQVKVSCIMSVDGFKLWSGYWIDLPSVSYNLWCFWLMSSFIINQNQQFKLISFFAHKLSESYSYHGTLWISFVVLPKFEVKVELPPYLLEKEKALHGKVTVRCVKIRLRGKCIITINL